MAFAKFSDYFEQLDQPWNPICVDHVNGNDLMVGKALGSYPWHVHDNSDDVFIVLQGSITIQLRDQDIVLNQGEMYVVPQGVEHRPVAQEAAYFLLIEKSGINSVLCESQ